MKCRGFKLVARRLPTGHTAWSVSGSINGTQIRRQFGDQTDAETFRDQQESLLFGRGPNKTPVRPHLSDPEVREAEAAFQILKERLPGRSLIEAVSFLETMAPTVAADQARSLAAVLGRLRARHPGESLAAAVDYYLTHYQRPVSAVGLQAAAREYLEERARETEKRSLIGRQFVSIGREIARLELAFGAALPFDSLTTIALHDYLHNTFPKDQDDRPTYSNKSWNNRRGLLATFFTYGIQRGWRKENPVQALRCFKRHQLARGDVPILTAKSAAELMNFLETHQGGRLVPFFALTLFAGIRPDWKDGEISKLQAHHFVTNHHYIQLGRDITKTGRKRHTVIQPNLQQWLTRYPLETFPIICPNLKKLYPKIRKQFGLQHDVLRHTYCSMLVGKYRSVAEAAIQAGNSEKVLWDSYLDLVSEEEAQRFWEIEPTTKVVAEKPESTAAVDAL